MLLAASELFPEFREGTNGHIRGEDDGESLPDKKGEVASPAHPLAQLSQRARIEGREDNAGEPSLDFVEPDDVVYANGRQPAKALGVRFRYYDNRYVSKADLEQPELRPCDFIQSRDESNQCLGSRLACAAEALSPIDRDEGRVRSQSG